MIVTKIEPVTKTKYKIELDGEFAFVLYKSELSRFSVKEQELLSEDVYQKIKQEVLVKRAKLRAMHLLNNMDRTEEELRKKLKENLYPDDVTEAALEYVKSFGYIDDHRYALNYIESRRNSKSKKEILASLSGKGLAPELLDIAFEEAYEETGEQEAILKLLKKKKFEEKLEDPRELQKLYAYLARKGFRYEDIRRVVQNYDVNA